MPAESWPSFASLLFPTPPYIQYNVQRLISTKQRIDILDLNGVRVLIRFFVIKPKNPPAGYWKLNIETSIRSARYPTNQPYLSTPQLFRERLLFAQKVGSRISPSPPHPYFTKFRPGIRAGWWSLIVIDQTPVTGRENGGKGLGVTAITWN